MLTLLTASAVVVAVALAAVSITSLVRAVTFIGPKVERGVKPWACNTCMSAWTTAVCTVGVTVAAVIFFMDWRFFLFAFLGFPAHGLAVMLLQRLAPAPFIEALKE